MLRPNTTPRGCAPSRSAIAARASTTMVSARCSAAVTVPRLATAARIVAATASATGAATWEPPGPSKCAAPSASEGKAARTLETS